MSGKPSSSPPSPAAGSAGFSGFARALREDWRGTLGRFALGLVVASLAWLLIAPAYAWGLAGAARLAAPLIEKAPGTRYEPVGRRVHVVRPVTLPGEQRPRELVYIAWAASANFGVPLLCALVMATPGWTWRRRGTALAWGLGFLTLTQIAFTLVTIEFWQQMPVRSPAGGVVYLPGHTPRRLAIVSPLFYFFEIMGRGFFALLVYFGLLAASGRPRRAAPGTARPNERCPCGSGLKYKRCCGAVRR